MVKKYKIMKKIEIKNIEVGQMIRCKPIHLRGGNSLRWRKVTQKIDSPHKWQYSGIAVNAHGYKDFWLKLNEIAEID